MPALECSKLHPGARVRNVFLRHVVCALAFSVLGVLSENFKCDFHVSILCTPSRHCLHYLRSCLLFSFLLGALVMLCIRGPVKIVFAFLVLDCFVVICLNSGLVFVVLRFRITFSNRFI